MSLYDDSAENPTPELFYRPRTATGAMMLHSESVREIDRQIEYVRTRAEHRVAGEQILIAMLHLGGAFRFIEKLYAEDQIDFVTRRMAGNLLCEKYEDLREEAFMYEFSRGNPKNAGCL